MKLEYKGLGGYESVCGLEITKSNGKVKVVLTELPENKGTSVTNFVEHLATLVYHRYLEDTPIENIVWVEHYPWSRFLQRETFDQVKMDWDGKAFSHPQWKYLTLEQYEVI